MKKKFNLKFFLFLGVIIALASIAVSAYIYIEKHSVPECSTVVKMFDTLNDGRVIKKVIFINVIKSGWREATFEFHGNISEGNKSYLLSRQVVTEYSYKNGYYYFKIKEGLVNPRDGVKRPDLNALFPKWKSNLYLHISQLNENSFMFLNNNVPVFICNKNKHP